MVILMHKLAKRFAPGSSNIRFLSTSLREKNKLLQNLNVLSTFKRNAQAQARTNWRSWEAVQKPSAVTGNIPNTKSKQVLTNSLQLNLFGFKLS